MSVTSVISDGIKSEFKNFSDLATEASIALHSLVTHPLNSQSRKLQYEASFDLRNRDSSEQVILQETLGLARRSDSWERFETPVKSGYCRGFKCEINGSSYIIQQYWVPSYDDVPNDGIEIIVSHPEKEQQHAHVRAFGQVILNKLEQRLRAQEFGGKISTLND
jgi:hypothetical protein